MLTERQRKRALRVLDLPPQAALHYRELVSTTYIISWDLAQGGADYSALSVTARTQPRYAEPARYAVEWLERFRDRRTARLPERTLDVYQRLYERHRRRLFETLRLDDDTLPSIVLVIDQTGVGPFGLDPFVERGMQPMGITIHGGDAVTQPKDRPNEYRVPKRDLASAVYNLLESQRLKVAASLTDAEVLRKELANFRIKITKTGHDMYEAGAGVEWREGQNDDMVLSVACGVWIGEFSPMPQLDPAILASFEALPGDSMGRR